MTLAQVESVYVEVLNAGSPKIQVESVYVEVLVPSVSGLSGTSSLTVTVTSSADGSGVAGRGASLTPSASLTADGQVSTSGDASLSGTVALSAAGVTAGGLAGSATLTTTTVTLTAAGNLAVAVAPWTADYSGLDLLGVLDDSPVLLIVEHPPTTAPATVTERPIVRVSHQMPMTTGTGALVSAHSDGTYPVVTADVGVPHVWVDGVDVTYFRNIPTLLGTMTTANDGGDETLAIAFPQLTPYDVPGTGDLTWLHADASVDVAIVPATGARIPLFNGHLVSDNVAVGEGHNDEGWHVEGSLMQAGHVGHKVPIILNPTDIGTLIPKGLNSVVSRRYATIPSVATSITTRQRGTYGDTELDYCKALLATAWTTGAQQWSLKRTTTPRAYVLALRDMTTVNWTVSTGAPGVECDLTADSNERLDAIYGRGVGPDGYSWAGWCYPNLLAYAPPAYPNSDPGVVMGLGATDAGTTSGNGISVWQRRAVELGYRISVDGVLNSDDILVVRAIQKAKGISVDGSIGPQTWTATFDIGTTGADLNSAYRRPLWIRPEVDPYLYSANGAIIGPNPSYDPSIIRREIEIDYGPGVTKAVATASAALQGARSIDPGWAGTITLPKFVSPWEDSSWLMFEGQNVKLLGWRGSDRLLHIVATSKDPNTGDVQLTVDSKARDAMTLSSILARDVGSRSDPARRPGNINTISHQVQNMIVDYDGESGAGVLPRIAINGDSGLWSVWPVFISQTGNLAKVDIKTDSPATTFSMGLFGAPITPNQCAAEIGNPFSPNAWTHNLTTLQNSYGYINSWGNDTQKCGDGTGGIPAGELIDTGGLGYISTLGGWTWVAIYTSVSTDISGRFYPSPVV